MIFVKENSIYAPRPSKFAVDPAAENGKVSPYAPCTLMSVSIYYVHCHMGTKSEGLGAL